MHNRLNGDKRAGLEWRPSTYWYVFFFDLAGKISPDPFPRRRPDLAVRSTTQHPIFSLLDENFGACESPFVGGQERLPVDCRTQNSFHCCTVIRTYDAWYLCEGDGVQRTSDDEGSYATSCPLEGTIYWGYVPQSRTKCMLWG